MSKIDGELLLKFLKAIAPVKVFLKEGILDDWKLPDLVNRKALLAIHRNALGENWEIFENSREVLIETLFFDTKQKGGLQKTVAEFTKLIGMNWEEKHGLQKML